MKQFNRMTLVAAAEVLAEFKSHSDMEVLELQWGIAGRCGSSSKSARVASLAAIAIEENLQVLTEQGGIPLERALVEASLKSPAIRRTSGAWNKLVAGLRFDGFEVVQAEAKPGDYQSLFPGARRTDELSLVRMLPADIPELNFREAESEIITLLEESGFQTAKGHLNLALSAFQRGEWASANGQLRNFLESYLNEIALGFGCPAEHDSKAKRDYLGTLEEPFLLSDYNEWSGNNQKPQYVQGLMSRMHPHGGHPGLSEEEDAAFRLQVNLVTARLFLRRYRNRQNGAGR